MDSASSDEKSIHAILAFWFEEISPETWFKKDALFDDMLMRKFEKIIEIADKILKTDPKNIDAYFYKLGAQYETGDMKAVLKTTDAMIKNNPDDPTGYELRLSLIHISEPTRRS